MIYFKIDYKILIIPRIPKFNPTKPQPQVDHVENVIVIWLDQSTNKSKYNSDSKAKLQQVVNSVKIFFDPDACHSFMSGIKDEKIFIIMSGTVEEKFVSSIHDEKQLESIYILSSNTAQTPDWFNQYPEISGVYASIVSVCQQLESDVKKLDYNLVGFEIMEKSLPSATPKADRQDAMFMYDQLFRDIVLGVSDQNMQDMYEFCQKQYQGSQKDLSF